MKKDQDYKVEEQHRLTDKTSNETTDGSIVDTKEVIIGENKFSNKKSKKTGLGFLKIIQFICEIIFVYYLAQFALNYKNDVLNNDVISLFKNDTIFFIVFCIVISVMLNIVSFFSGLTNILIFIIFGAGKSNAKDFKNNLQNRVNNMLTFVALFWGIITTFLTVLFFKYMIQYSGNNVEHDLTNFFTITNVFAYIVTFITLYAYLGISLNAMDEKENS